MLNENDLNRYSRQIIIPGFEEEGQEILLSKKVLIIGAGGLGCPTALYCSASGFGYIEIWDHDNVELSNLNRQIGHKEIYLNQKKAESLVNSCKEINSSITILSRHIEFDLKADLTRFDLIFDCTDNLNTRYLINKLSHNNRKILISGSATQLEGQVLVLKSGLDNKYPCYECVFPQSSANYPVQNCRDAGILGSVTGLIASLQVNEGIRETLKHSSENINVKNFYLNTSNAGYLIIYDASLLEINKIKISKNHSCNICKN